MQSHELVALIEAAGKGYVGANIDSRQRGLVRWRNRCGIWKPSGTLHALQQRARQHGVGDRRRRHGAVDRGGRGVGGFCKAYAQALRRTGTRRAVASRDHLRLCPPLHLARRRLLENLPSRCAPQISPPSSTSPNAARKSPAFKAPEGDAKKPAEIAYQKGEFVRPILEMLVTLPSGGAASLAASAACPLLI
jgi:3-oxoisoapionate decarboxylase